MANKVLVFLEQRSGKLKKAAFEAAKFASDLANKIDAESIGIVIGSEIENCELIGGYGIKKVVHKKSQLLGDYSSSAYSKLIADYADENEITDIVFSNTSMGKELAPLVAAKTGSGIVVDITGYEISGSEIIFSKPVYAGKTIIDLKLNSNKKVISIRPNVFGAGEASGDKAECTIEDVLNPDLRTKVIEFKRSEGKLDVAEADIIVSGGRGMKAPEHFNLIEELADVLGAAQGASRAVVDAGWRPHSEQVGQTGKTVSPNLYIAAGISGAIQHLAGMRSSKYIVAINKDKEAPIFQVADYGIAGDVFEVLPVLIDELKKVKEK